MLSDHGQAVQEELLLDPETLGPFETSLCCTSRHNTISLKFCIFRHVY